MSFTTKCQCCLVRPPDKDLKTTYKKLGKTEVYADMLKECFEINITHINMSEAGICEVCITRLRDACDFKSQVIYCQKELLVQATGTVVADLKVKEEVSDVHPDDENGILFLELKEELSDFSDADDNTHLIDLISRSDVTVKKRSLTKKNGKKRSVLKKAGSDLLSESYKISLRTFAQMEKLKQTIVLKDKSTHSMTKHSANLKNVLKHSNCTPFLNKTLSGYTCAYCKETLTDLAVLRTHTHNLHKNDDIQMNKRRDKNNLSIKVDITDLKCNICNANFDVITNLKKHLTLEHDIKFYPDINDYILEFKETDNEILNCALCHSTFETFKMLLQHMNGHYRNYICEVCDMGFINKHRLKNHQRTHEVGNFKCSYCDKVFVTRVRMVCHEKYTHNPSARYTTNCPQCDKSFTSYYQRNRHMFTEHNTSAATYKCNICDKSFIMKSKLTSHIKKVHLMERNHICSECGQGFFIKQSLDEHMIKHNGERVFKCMVCHKAYARKKTLREHMRIHNNDRRFKCGVCGTAFVQKCSLKSHMLSNHGITLSEFETARNSVGSP